MKRVKMQSDQGARVFVEDMPGGSTLAIPECVHNRHYQELLACAESGTLTVHSEGETSAGNPSVRNVTKTVSARLRRVLAGE